MPQPIMIGLIAAMAMLAAAILGLAGVLAAAKINWKLGKRTGDIQQQGVGIQQQTVDIARIEKLSKENEDLRAENQEQYTANRQLRHDLEAADMQHKTACATWDAERQGWRAERGQATSALVTAQARIASLEEALTQSDAVSQVALAAQAAAEAGLKTAMKTISEFSPCP